MGAASERSACGDTTAQSAAATLSRLNRWITMPDPLVMHKPGLQCGWVAAGFQGLPCDSAMGLQCFPVMDGRLQFTPGRQLGH
jgi:hypothetical protein